MLNQNKFTVLPQFIAKKNKMVSSASLIMKNNVAFPTSFKFPIKLICCIAFRSTSTTYSLLKYISVSLIMIVQIWTT